MKLIKENIPFTMVANEVLKDPNLSFKAKGLYSYLFSKPDDWDFSSNRMILETKDRRESIMSGLKELEEAGYLLREKLPNGRMEYTLKHSTQSLSRETPLRVSKPKSGNPTVGKPHSGKSRLISNTDNTTNTEEKVIQINTSDGIPSQDIQSFINLFKEVNPSHERLFGNKTERACATRLLKKYGIEKMTATLEKLPEIIKQPYAPKITTPYELEKNLGKLIAFVEQNKNIINNKKPIVHI